jgi:hypothetical protein
LSVLAIAATACGPSLAQQEAMESCREQCGLDLAGCLESRTCLAIDGQIIPCEEECQAEHEACEESCASN